MADSCTDEKMTFWVRYDKIDVAAEIENEKYL